MKKALAILIVLLCFVQAQASSTVVVVGQGAAEGGSPSCGGTKIIGEDGDLSTAGTVNAGRWTAFRYSATSTGNAGCVKLYVNSCGTATNEDFGVAIYSNAANGAGDDDDMPDTGIAYYENASWSCATGLQEFVLNDWAALSNGGLYWIAVFGTNEQIVYELDSDGTPATTEFRLTGTGQTYDSRPSGGWSVNTDRIMSWSAW